MNPEEYEFHYITDQWAMREFGTDYAIQSLDPEDRDLIDYFDVKDSNQ